jgi:catechol 2,3-dioxygenase-like lactoylglutathione lyase family enzyme
MNDNAAGASARAESVKELRFDHVGVSVADLNRSHAFYRDVFGFTTLEEQFSLPQHQIAGRVLTNAAGVRIELFERQGSAPGAPGHPTDSTLRQGYFQFALRVLHLDMIYAQVVSAGAREILPPRLAPDGRSHFAFVSDPDGNLVELIQRAESKS